MYPNTYNTSSSYSSNSFPDYMSSSSSSSFPSYMSSSSSSSFPSYMSSSSIPNYSVNSDNRIIGGGFLGPFILGGITGGLVAPYFYPRPYYYPYQYYGPYYR